MRYPNLVTFLNAVGDPPASPGQPESAQLAKILLDERPESLSVPDIVVDLWSEINGDGNERARILPMIRILHDAGSTYGDLNRPAWHWCMDQAWLYDIDQVVTERERSDWQAQVDNDTEHRVDPNWIPIDQTAGGDQIILDGEKLGFLPSRPWDDDTAPDYLAAWFPFDSFAILLDTLEVAIKDDRFTLKPFDEWENYIIFENAYRYDEAEWVLL